MKKSKVLFDLQTEEALRPPNPSPVATAPSRPKALLFFRQRHGELLF